VPPHEREQVDGPQLAAGATISHRPLKEIAHGC
jgi:hypothetical protein